MVRNFEELVLLAILMLRDNAYGVTICDELERVTGRSYTLGTIYSTLDELEKKQYVTSWRGQATPERGGRAKRFFKLEPKGKEALKTVNQYRNDLVQNSSLLDLIKNAFKVVLE